MYLDSVVHSLPRADNVYPCPHGCTEFREVYASDGKEEDEGIDYQCAHGHTLYDSHGWAVPFGAAEECTEMMREGGFCCTENGYVDRCRNPKDVCPNKNTHSMRRK